MKLLHVTPTYLPARRYGGPIYSAHGLCRALAAAGHECHVYTTSVDGRGDSEVSLDSPVLIDSVHVTYFRSPYARRIFYSPDMKKAMKANIEKFDVVHLHSPYVWPTWMAASMALEHKKPYVMMTRGMLVKDLVRKKSRWAKNLWIRWIEKRNLEKASLVQFTTSAEEAEVRRFGFDLKKAVVLGHGVDEPSAQNMVLEEAREDIKPFLVGKPFLLYIGRISWEKGLTRLIGAMAQVKDIRLVLIGNDDSGYSQKLKVLARKHGVADRVVFAGPYHGSVKDAMYQKAHLFILPSFYENFGNVVLEAMLQGCPVIVTAGVGLADFVVKSGGGLVVDGSPESLANAVNQLLSDSTLRSQMRIVGPKAVRENFMWDKIAEKMVDCYKRLI